MTRHEMEPSKGVLRMNKPFLSMSAPLILGSALIVGCGKSPSTPQAVIAQKDDHAPKLHFRLLADLRDDPAAIARSLTESIPNKSRSAGENLKAPAGFAWFELNQAEVARFSSKSRQRTGLVQDAEQLYFVSEDGRNVFVLTKSPPADSNVTERDVVAADLLPDNEVYQVRLKFTASAADRMAQLTSKPGRQLAVVFDDKVIVAAWISGPLRDEVQIAFGYDAEDLDGMKRASEFLRSVRERMKRE